MSLPTWVDQLNAIPADWKLGTKSIRQLFEEASPPDLSETSAREQLLTRLERDPDVIDAWQTYSCDKRGTPSPYLDGLKVGFYDDSDRDVVEHPTLAEACADFLNRETAWVLHRERRM